MCNYQCFMWSITFAQYLKRIRKLVIKHMQRVTRISDKLSFMKLICVLSIKLNAPKRNQVLYFQFVSKDELNLISWVALGSFGYLWVASGTFRYVQVPSGTSGYLRVSLGTFGYFWEHYFKLICQQNYHVG